MNFLKNILLNSNEYKKLDSAIERNSFPISLTGLSGIHKAHIIYSQCKNRNCKAFVIASDETEAQKFSNDFSSMGLVSLVYESKDFNFGNIEVQSKEYEHKRLRVLLKLLSNDFDVLITCIDAAVQYTVPSDELRKMVKTFKVGDNISPQNIIDILISCGYQRYEQVEGVGQFSLRGGILDFFSPNSSYPIRIEFWGDEIDTISEFDIETQRRTESVTNITISPSAEVIIDSGENLADKIKNFSEQLKDTPTSNAKEILLNESCKIRNSMGLGSLDKFISLIYDKPATLFDYTDKNILLFISEPVRIKERMRSFMWQWGEDLKLYLEDGTLCKGLDKFFEDWTYCINQFENRRIVYLDVFAHSNYDVSPIEFINFTARQLSAWSGSIQILLEDLNAMFTDKSTCVILAGTERSAISIEKDLIAKGLPVGFANDFDNISKGKIYIVPGSLSAGFEYPDVKFSLITYGIFNKKNNKKTKHKKKSNEICSLSELSKGDYVVHSAHGIGVFEGIHKINMQGIIKDYIKLSYAKGDTLYVPVTQLDMVSKYIGPRENLNVRLHRLGSSDWQKSKTRVKKAVKDMAKELIKLFSERMNAKGHAFASDNEWQRDFESRFEYEETEDQLSCIEEIKSDMERQSPMDRLLCGDVGFGKTEVALRAAFKCVTDSKQCAMLVPTTILAWQHFQTIIRRFEGFPIRIELLSRFRTQKQQEDVIKRIERGEVDLVIGTHRLVQKDVVFRNLGLVIIDEEQRFGVSQKEKFKQMYKNVDVLTLSATPIPRTLNMAMSGIRDMSVLEEAPQDRHPVQTYVLEHDLVLINEAIRRELRRGGQIYYLHNKVESIERVAESIRKNIPEANVGVGHGKMSENELSKVWQKMMEQEINVLVCTTIIETGIDLPNVNTLIIDNADHMGLSQLHQIRGRVGRSSRRAYAYLTLKKDKVLTEISQKRLSTIREFTEFGSGFKIAMRDLELRGAGNILGAAQHGNMEDVGYDMYIKLLGDAVKEEKGEQISDYEIECLVDVQMQAHIPENYIENLNQRIDIYRRISDIRTSSDASDVIDELIDRFGDPPKSVKGLIDVALIRNTAASLGIYEIKQKNNSLLFYQKNIDMKQVANIISGMNEKVMVNAGSKPYISIKINNNDNPINIIIKFFNVASKDKGS